MKGRLNNEYILPVPAYAEELCLKLRIMKNGPAHPLYPELKIK